VHIARVDVSGVAVPVDGDPQESRLNFPRLRLDENPSRNIVPKLHHTFRSVQALTPKDCGIA
jgi:hypothetical protein